MEAERFSPGGFAESLNRFFPVTSTPNRDQRNLPPAWEVIFLVRRALCRYDLPDPKLPITFADGKKSWLMNAT